MLQPNADVNMTESGSGSGKPAQFRCVCGIGFVLYMAAVWRNSLT